MNPISTFDHDYIKFVYQDPDVKQGFYYNHVPPVQPFSLDKKSKKSGKTEKDKQKQKKDQDHENETKEKKLKKPFT